MFFSSLLIAVFLALSKLLWELLLIGSICRLGGLSVVGFYNVSPGLLCDDGSFSRIQKG